MPMWRVFYPLEPVPAPVRVLAGILALDLVRALSTEVFMYYDVLLWGRLSEIDSIYKLKL
jgi:hypothetical protein